MQSVDVSHNVAQELLSGVTQGFAGMSGGFVGGWQDCEAVWLDLAAGGLGNPQSEPQGRRAGAVDDAAQLDVAAPHERGKPHQRDVARVEILSEGSHAVFVPMRYNQRQEVCASPSVVPSVPDRYNKRMGRPRKKPEGGAPNRIAEVREALDVSQEKLAELTGLSHATIQRYESGKRNVSLKRLTQIAQALKLHAVKELLPFNQPHEQRKLLPAAGNQPGPTTGEEELPEIAAVRIERILQEMLKAQKTHNEYVVAMLEHIVTNVTPDAGGQRKPRPERPAPEHRGKPS